MMLSETNTTANRMNGMPSTQYLTAEEQAVLAGEAFVVPIEDEAEVAQRTAEFLEELRPTGSLGATLVRRAARLAIRMERCAERELAMMTERVVEALAHFEAPEGMDEAEIDQLRVETARLAAFDTSKEACMARRHEAAAERGFYRALKEFRLVEKQAKARQNSPEPVVKTQELGSFFPGESMKAILDSLPAEKPISPAKPAPTAPISAPRSSFEVPISIGRAG